MPSSSNFIWGVATSAYQIEGARSVDGKGDSIWDTFSDLGRLADPGDIACDHYNRLDSDLDLLAQLGVGGYRFSIAWTRILPDGVGDINPAGLDFYTRLADRLLERGIQPFPTLYHWDLPQALQDQGGWENRATVDAFANYAGLVASALGERVTHWTTHNEPWVATMLGHQTGQHAPGVSDWTGALRAGHHILLSHGRAATRIRARVPGASVGIALDSRPASPTSRAEQDMSAAKHFDGFRNRWFFDPVFGRGYPEDMVDAYVSRNRLPKGLATMVEAGDMEEIATPLDFLGINYYTTVEVSAGNEEKEEPGGEVGAPASPGFTEMGWKIDPDGLTRFLRRVQTTYEPRSILITENGASYSDAPNETGRVNDQRRIDYLKAHIQSIADARREEVPVDGYFVWSFMDNLEWTLGFSQRFGLVHVDHSTQRRTPKDSFHWYEDVVSHETPESALATLQK